MKVVNKIEKTEAWAKDHKLAATVLTIIALKDGKEVVSTLFWVAILMFMMLVGLGLLAIGSLA